MGVSQVGGVKVVGDAPLLSDLEGALHLLVLLPDAQDTGHQGQIGAVAVIGPGEGAVETEGDTGKGLAEKEGGQTAQTGGPGRVRAGGADHDGTGHLKHTDDHGIPPAVHGRLSAGGGKAPHPAQ